MTQLPEIVERFSPLLLELHEYTHLLRIQELFLTSPSSHSNILLFKRDTLLVINKQISCVF